MGHAKRSHTHCEPLKTKKTSKNVLEPQQKPRKLIQGLCLLSSHDVLFHSVWLRRSTQFILGCLRGAMVKAMDCGIVIRKFVLQSRYYVHFRANTLGKGMNPLILPPAMG